MSHEHAPGTRQSPVKIDYKCLHHDPNLKPLQFDHDPADCVEITNKGTTWSIKIKTDPATKLQGSHLPGTYRLAELHAHWGEGDCDGSEHMLGDDGYAAEIHLVHYDGKYKLIDDAKSHGDGLAVLGVFLKESQEDNPNLEPLIHALQRVPYKGQVTKFPNGLDLCKLLPRNRDFCTYHGSLTTPPYTECVIWTVLAHPIPISRRQLDVFRDLNAHDEQEKIATPVKIINNYRQCQDVGQRKILATFHPPNKF